MGNKLRIWKRIIVSVPFNTVTRRHSKLIMQCTNFFFWQTQAEVIDKSLIESESEVRNHVNTGTWTQQQVTHANLRLHTHHDDSGHSSGGEGGGGGPGSGVGIGGGGGGGSSSPPVVHDGKHSLLQFALQHFRCVYCNCSGLWFSTAGYILSRVTRYTALVI